jgi:hypothetical protein
MRSTKVSLTQTIRFEASRYPEVKDGKLAVARLSPDGNGGVVTNKDELKANGFKQVGDQAWVHTDGSWAQVSQDGDCEFGIGKHRLNEQPQLVATVVRGKSIVDTRPSLADKPWSWFKNNIAIGKVALSANTDGDEARQLISAGFVLAKNSKQGDTWVHPDGSWAKVGEGSNTLGWKGYAMAELSKPHPLGHLLTERPRIPASMEKCALAQLGILSGRAAAQLRAAGFEQSKPKTTAFL